MQHTTDLLFVTTKGNRKMRGVRGRQWDRDLGEFLQRSTRHAVLLEFATQVGQVHLDEPLQHPFDIPVL